MENENTNSGNHIEFHTEFNLLGLGLGILATIGVCKVTIDGYKLVKTLIKRKLDIQ